MMRPNSEKPEAVTQGLESKAKNVEQIIDSLRRVVVAYSGGVDSTLLLKLCKDILGDKVLAITASSQIIPKKEIQGAIELARRLGARHQIVPLNPLGDANFVANPPERCYRCKCELYARLQDIAKEQGAFFVVDGTNRDDLDDYRPGQKAATKWGVRQPLLEAELTKEDVRSLSRSLGLPTWGKPSMACLASRFAYGQEITRERLEKVAQAEEVIYNLGLGSVRVRFHDENTARIEVEPDAIEQLLAWEARAEIVRKLQDLGFMYVTVDLKGYRTGSVNELLEEGR